MGPPQTDVHLAVVRGALGLQPAAVLRVAPFLVQSVVGVTFAMVTMSAASSGATLIDCAALTHGSNASHEVGSCAVTCCSRSAARASCRPHHDRPPVVADPAG